LSSKLTNYLIENHWNKWASFGWEKILNSECYAYIIFKNERYFYGKDCPDVNMPIEDYFKDLFFEDEEKLIQFLEELKLTKPT
jgi:hypothetical protein